VPGPFDTTLRYLVQTYPADWVTFLGHASPGLVEIVDANLSAVSAEVDKVVLVGDADPWLVHLEFQSSYDATIGQRLVRYNTMLHLQHQLTVASVLVLLRPAANGPAVNGEYRLALPGGEPYLTFTYAIRRLWHEPATELLRGALGTLPLAPLGATSRAALPGLLRAIDERFIHEAPPADAARLRVVTYTLLGLRYPSAVADQLLPGIRSMRDSSTYQAILDEGRVEGRAAGRAEGRAAEARELLLQLGEQRFGPPDERTLATLAAIGDHTRLRALATHLLDAASWDELLTSD
jgi:hypothetical protein